MSEFITRHVHEDQSIPIPAEIRRRLHPGATLTVENQEDGTLLLRFDAPAPTGTDAATESPKEPYLMEKGGLLIARGQIEEGLGWDAFMQEEREAPIHPFEPLEK